MPAWKHVRSGGVVFVFKYDLDDPSILHIFARHLMTVDDALRTWFDEDAEDTWNDEYGRFETRSDTRVLYWKWLTEAERVLVISCFTRED
jgi:hypothetical protein